MIFKAKKTNISIYLLSFSASGIGILLNFFLARVLEAEVFGRIQYYVALSTTISQFLIFGLNNFLIREAKNEAHNGELFDKCFSLFFVISLFSFPVVYHVLVNYLENTRGNNIISFLVIAVAILMSISTLVFSYFQGRGKYILTVTFDSLIPKLTLFCIALVFMLLSRLSFFSDNYLLFYVIVYSLIAVPFVFKLFSKINFKFSFGDLLTILFFFGVTVTYSLGNNLTKILQGSLYKNDVVLAIISISISIVSLVRVFTSVLDSMVKPIFAKQKREGDNEKILDTYRFDTRMNSYVAIPLYLFFIISSEKFLYIFGTSYLTYPRILGLICMANAVSELTGPNGTMLAMIGKEKWELFNGFLYFLTYTLSVFLFSFDKIYGLCFALLASQVVVNMAKYIEVAVIFKKMPLDFKTIMTLLLCIVIDGGIIFLIEFIGNFWIWLVVGFTSGICLVLLNVFAISFYRKHDFKKLISLKV